jgi:hypothetical protein
MQYLLQKLEQIRSSPSGRNFILADARDADMAWGIPSFGANRRREIGVAHSGRAFRSQPAFLDEVRSVVQQEVVDILLASVSVMDKLAHREHLFDGSRVTPAVRINDTTDVWCQRGARYRESPSVPFSTAYIEEAQFGGLTAPREGEPVVNLGLYSMTFNNDIHADLRTLNAFREFRAEAERKGFRYFLEVFGPNMPASKTGLTAEQVPDFVNDQIARSLAGVPSSSRPLFLKIPYFGPGPLEDLAAYDPSVVVGILGGSSGTTYDAFKLLAEAQKYGARVALFGRKIKDSEDPLAFIHMLRAITDGDISPEEAVRAYHHELERRGIKPDRPLKDDLRITATEMSYATA